jgi:SNF2 family DNA or RNA helicase
MTLQKQELSCIKRSNKQPHDYQVKIVEFMLKNRGLLVFHKVGSGKTLTAITTSQCYLDVYPEHQVIVIAPAGLIANFQKEMELSYVNLRNSKKYSYFSYQGFHNAHEQNKISCKKSLLIVDEAHHLRTIYHGSKNKEFGVMTKSVTECAENADKVLILSGTPIYNSIGDIASLYNLIRDPSTARITFNNAKYFDYQLFKGKLSFYDPGKSAEFPSRINHYISIYMTPSYLNKYEKLVKEISTSRKIVSPDFKDLYGAENESPSMFHNVLRRAVNNLENEKSQKIQWVVDKIVNPDTPGPIIVFSHWLDAGNKIIASALQQLNVPFAFIQGQIKMAERVKIVNDYNTGKIKVLLLSMAGGEGLDLKNTRTVILLEPSWNESTLEQVIGRAVRFRSHVTLPEDQRKVDVYYLDHIKPTDVKYFPQIKKMLNQEVYQQIKQVKITKKPGLFDKMTNFFNSVFTEPQKKVDQNILDVSRMSIDLLMRTYLKKKQKQIDEYNKILENLSIEKN